MNALCGLFRNGCLSKPLMLYLLVVMSCPCRFCGYCRGDGPEWKNWATSSAQARGSRPRGLAVPHDFANASWEIRTNKLYKHETQNVCVFNMASQTDFHMKSIALHLKPPSKPIYTRQSAFQSGTAADYYKSMSTIAEKTSI